jgi:formyltetrahydrofolate deformylase
MSAVADSFVLTLSCPDRVGVVAVVSQTLASGGANVLEAQHFLDPVSNRSVMRIVFQPAPAFDAAAFRPTFDTATRALGLSWALRPTSARMRVVIAVSKEGHCLNSLLHRWSVGTLPIEVVAVVSNHEDQRRLVEWHGLPFHLLPVGEANKAARERELLSWFTEYRGELLVLARYMQILSAAACAALVGRAINIHHSFLPGFKGAKPYTQAYERGVKLIGATAHYVNEELDDGSIIEQAVERVDHIYSPEQLTTLGNEIESVVLNRAVQWHAESRIFEFGNRTVILR